MRIAALKNLDSDVQSKIIAAALLQIAAIVTALLAKNGAEAILEGVLDLVDAVHLLLTAVGKKIVDGGGSPDIYTHLLQAAAVIDQLGSIAQTALGWYRTAGWIMQTAINGAVFAIKTGLGEGESVLVDITWNAFGSALSLVMNGVADNLLAQAAAEQGQENSQQNMDIGAWCGQYGGGACNGLPPS